MQPNIHWLEDPTVFRVNRLDAHSDHISCATQEEADAYISSLRQRLDGQWRFRWSPNPASRPENFWQEDFDLSDFTTIQVPGHMETQGFGQIQYTNKLYPWDGHKFLRPPQIDWDYNPVGSYVKEFDLEPALRGREVCISFRGIEQAAFVWCNGQFVGYCEDSFTPSDFDLTPYIREKGNRLCVQVHARSSAAWLEDQDFFRFSGIFRSVVLYAKPLLTDIWMQSTLHEDLETGDMRFRFLLDGNVQVQAEISHPEEGILFRGPLELTKEGDYWFSQTIPFEKVRLWDYRSPELYYVCFTAVRDDITEYTPYATGFRRIEIGEDKVIYLNGKRLMINGINRHEWSAENGRVVSLEDMNRAMETIRTNYINAVRTCHYPNRTAWYVLCDNVGIYVMDETNLETHGSWQKDALPDSIEPSWNIPGSLPEWRGAVLDRAKSMFERDKNHVSILFWSCGNEAFCGSNIVEMANYFRTQDPSRLVHYEGCYWTRGVANGKPVSTHWKPEYETVSDMESRMYATPAEIREYLENDPAKPYISCEYMHNMGNSLGGMESYVNLAKEFPMYQGGFVWDYMDQALWYTNCNGQRVLGYGGDFGDRQSDYNFSGNGIVTADGQPKPCMQELKFWHGDEKFRTCRGTRVAVAQADVKMPLHETSDLPLTVTHGDGNIGVRGQGFEILFSHAQAGPASLRWGSTEWFFRAPRPAFWRAPTENDIGCGFPGKSAIWSAVDQYQKCVGREILEDSPRNFAIRYTFSADILPDLKTDVTYRVDLSGNLDVQVHYHGGENRPQLPLLGLRFPTARRVSKTEWMGLSGETYPDRYKGADFGLNQEVPGLSNYLVPQECGNHMNTHWAKLHMDGAQLYMEKLEEPFHFSALPYTPQQIEQAYHREELPEPTRTVVTVCGAMRGVGGIDTWGNDVEEAYHVPSDKDILFRFRIRG